MEQHIGHGEVMGVTVDNLYELLDAAISALEKFAELATSGIWQRSSQYGRVDVVRYPYQAGDDLVAKDVDAYDALHMTIWTPDNVLICLAEDRDILTRHCRSEAQDWPPKYGPPPVSCGDCENDWPCPDILSLARRLGVKVSTGEQTASPKTD